VVKKLAMILLVAVLSGCSAPRDMETVSDVWVAPTPVPGRILLDLPAEAGEEALASGQSGNLYVCDDYVITAQTLPGGDTRQTLKTVTGFDMDQLTILRTQQAGMDSIHTVWTCAGESGTQLCRAEIRSDGDFHYVLSVSAPEDQAGRLEETWQALFDSFGVSYTAP
jgi:hypothetical protein